MTANQAPRHCPVCTHELVITGLGCPACGTGISGSFTPTPYDGLSRDELEMLRVFLVSRGNMRELEKHLRVSYPTTRQRFAELLGALGFESADSTAPVPDRVAVLADLAAGRIGIDDAADLISDHDSKG